MTDDIDIEVKEHENQCEHYHVRFWFFNDVEKYSQAWKILWTNHDEIDYDDNRLDSDGRSI